MLSIIFLFLFCSSIFANEQVVPINEDINIIHSAGYPRFVKAVNFTFTIDEIEYRHINIFGPGIIHTYDDYLIRLSFESHTASQLNWIFQIVIHPSIWNTRNILTYTSTINTTYVSNPPHIMNPIKYRPQLEVTEVTNLRYENDTIFWDPPTSHVYLDRPVRYNISIESPIKSCESNFLLVTFYDPCMAFYNTSFVVWVKAFLYPEIGSNVSFINITRPLILNPPINITVDTLVNISVTSVNLQPTMGAQSKPIKIKFILFATLGIAMCIGIVIVTTIIIVVTKRSKKVIYTAGEFYDKYEYIYCGFKIKESRIKKKPKPTQLLRLQQQIERQRQIEQQREQQIIEGTYEFTD